MNTLNDGETAEVKGSAKDPYLLKNTGGVYSCSCPAWRNQSIAIEKRTCKHLRQYLGEEFERDRIGGELPEKSPRTRSPKAASTNSEDGSETSSVPGLLLAHSWEGDIDLHGWWMSEKLDGVRAYWDGDKFISRQGNIYLAPDWFVEDLPKDIHLDGELWMGRKLFQRAVGVVRRQDKSEDWRDIRFVVFDAPALDEVFEARIAFIQQLLDEIGSLYVHAHVHVRCEDEVHLREELARVESIGGEGLMLRKPGSKYEVGRSSTLLKVKSFHDAEATVLEHLPGTGKHKGRLGALMVELADGTRFSVGTGFSDAERETPPAVGSVITFRYQELSDRGVPRFPSYVRKRTDGESTPKTALTSAPPAVALSAVPKSTVLANTELKADSKLKTESKTKLETEAKAKTPAASAVSTKAKTVKRERDEDEDFDEDDDNEDSDDPGSSDNDGSTWRHFEFSEGSSDKFWEVKRSGNEVIVKFGRKGTNGQEKAKSFANESAAKKYYDDIIVEKTKKGYEET